jgi:hypothetical protein
MRNDAPDQGTMAPVMAFDPQWFRSDYRVVRWEPRREVLFDKPLKWGWLAAALLSFLASVLLLGGAARLLQGGLQPTPTLEQPVIVLVVMAFFVLLLGAGGYACLGVALPRRVHIDWSTATITIGRFRKKETPFSQIVGLETHRAHQRYAPSRSGSSARVRHYYWCELKAKIRMEDGQSAPPLVLVETEQREGDANGPFLQMLPLAAELANALGVKHDVASSSQDVGRTRAGENPG